MKTNKQVVLSENTCTYVGGDSTEFELWEDLIGGKTYKIPTTIHRDWDNAEQIN